MNQKQKENELAYITCISCQASAPWNNVSEISEDDKQQIFIIQIDVGETYCMRCLQLQVKKQTQQTRVMQQRFIYYKQFQSSFQDKQSLFKIQKKVQDQTQLNIQSQIQKLKHDYEQIIKNITNLNNQSNNLKQKIYNFQVQEEKFWEGINKIQRRTNRLQEKTLQTKIQNFRLKDFIQQLSKFSVIHGVLNIQIDDTLGYIQGMALGKRPQNSQVNWDQVAIGLGHLLLGLNFLSLKYSYEYQRIQSMKLKGCQSEIILRNKKRIYLLINNRENQKYFGQVLEAILCQVQFLGQFILQSESIQYSEEYKLPFQMNIQGKIIDIWIDPMKLQERFRWTQWTKAMRYFLINFKHIITVYAINDKHL